MFSGEFEYKIDEKGRVPIPPKFRKDLKDGVVLTTGPENNINAYTVSEFNKKAAALTSDTFAPAKMRRLNRAFFSSAFHLTIDNQGRIALPAPLRAYAGIEDEVVISGVNTYLEMWDKQQWDAEITISREQLWQNIESMEHR